MPGHTTWICLHPRCNRKRVGSYGVGAHRMAHRNRGEYKFQMESPTHRYTYDLTPRSV